MKLPTIRRVARATLDIAPGPPQWQTGNTALLDAHWAQASAANEAIFDGQVFLASEGRIADGTVHVTCHLSRFATLDWWRTHGKPEIGFRNIFGSMVLRGSDGALIGGLMAPHTSVPGLFCFPGGSFDRADIDGTGIDAAGGILRECVEETGLAPGLLTVQPGYLAGLGAREICIARIADFAEPAEALLARIEDWSARQTRPEFSEFRILRQPSDLALDDGHGLTRALAGFVLGGG